MQFLLDHSESRLKSKIIMVIKSRFDTRMFSRTSFCSWKVAMIQSRMFPFRLQSALPPGRSFVVKDTSQLPKIIQEIFDANIL